ncbi:MAG: PIN domain-containing protein [Verrucomicrobiota bacterium]
MPRTQYIFIDYENVSESDLSRVTGKAVRVFMIIGTRHKKLPTSLFLFAQDHPQQLRIIQTPVEGCNALDFVLTLEVGRSIAADPEGYFHIVSKDTDFDSVVRHLKAEKQRIARHTALADIPALRTPEERLVALHAELSDATKPRPLTRKTLENRIKSAFENKVEQDFVEKTITQLVQTGIFSITDTDRVDYKAA